MSKEYENITLANLNGGAAEELFQLNLEKITEDIEDPNSVIDYTREITLKIGFTPPAKDGEPTSITVKCTKKTAPTNPSAGFAYNTKEGFVQIDHKQPELPYGSQVVEINRKTGEINNG